MLRSVVTVGMDQRLVEEIDEIAKKDKSSRAAVLRRLISDALDRHRLRTAIQMYKGRQDNHRKGSTDGWSLNPWDDRVTSTAGCAQPAHHAGYQAGRCEPSEEDGQARACR